MTLATSSFLQCKKRDSHNDSRKMMREKSSPFVLLLRSPAINRGPTVAPRFIVGALARRISAEGGFVQILLLLSLFLPAYSLVVLGSKS